jgi:chorismate mutase
MTERQNRPATEREEIASRIARFKATQEKFAREREEYAATTMENALNRAPRWPSQKSARPG